MKSRANSLANLEKRTPFAPNNKVSQSHSLYSKQLRPFNRAEVEQLADTFRELSPLQSPSVEPLVQLAASQFFRWQQANAYVARVGVTAGAYGKPTPMLKV